MSEGIKNPFKKELMRRQFDACVYCYFTRHKDLFREDGSRHTGNGVANQFWWGFDGVRTPEQWDGSRDTPAYASYRAGEMIARYESALAAKDAEIARLREALEGLVACHDGFEASTGNMEDAYYKLAKYARPEWDAARAALREPSL